MDVERAILGAVLLEGRPALERVAARATAEDFYLEGHRVLYHRMLCVDEAAGGVDVLSLKDALTEAGEIDAIGGASSLALLETEGCIAARLDHYLTLLLRDAGRRRIIQRAGEAITQAFDATADTTPAQIAASLGDDLARIAERAEATADGAEESIGDVAVKLVAELAASVPTFVRYPLAGLNRILGGGSKPGELVYLGAGFGTGKTAIALEWAASVAQDGQTVLVVSAEMTKRAVTGRVIAQRAMVPAADFRSGEFDPDDFVKVRAAAQALGALPIILDDEAVTLGAIRRLVRKHRPTLVIIDFLQLLQGPPSEGKRHEINAISRALKRLAKRAPCVILALSQLTLVPDGHGKFQRPNAASLKESRGPSEDADTVLLLWRPDPDTRALELIVGKGRDHATGSVALEFTPMFLWFREV